MEVIKKRSLIITNVSIVLSFASLMYVLIYNHNEDYSSLWILPISFMLLSPFLLRGLKKIPFAPFVIVFYSVNFVRYVLLPFLIVFANHYNYRSPQNPSATSIFQAELLMVFELMVICAFFCLRRVKYPKENAEIGVAIYSDNFSEKPRHDIYHIYIALCLIIYITIPSVRNSINIVFPNNSNTDEISPFVLLLVLMVILAKNLVFILLLQKLYEKRVKGIALYISLFFLVAVNSSIYYGINRSDFLLSMIACIYTASKIYSKPIKRIAIIILPLCFIVFNMITEIRNYYSFSTDPVHSFIDTCQGYSGSLYNVAISVEAAAKYPENRNIIVLINDFLRPSLGFNMLMKPLQIPLSNQIFNARMYMSTDHVAQIMPMIGQGYYLLGAMFAPLLDIIFCDILVRLVKMLKKCDFESVFFLTITCTRLGFLVAQNSQIQMNDLSFNLFLFFILHWINKHFYFKRRQR